MSDMAYRQKKVLPPMCFCHDSASRVDLDETWWAFVPGFLQLLSRNCCGPLHWAVSSGGTSASLRPPEVAVGWQRWLWCWPPTAIPITSDIGAGGTSGESAMAD